MTKITSTAFNFVVILISRYPVLIYLWLIALSVFCPRRYRILRAALIATAADTATRYTSARPPAFQEQDA